MLEATSNQTPGRAGLYPLKPEFAQDGDDKGLRLTFSTLKILFQSISC